MIEIIWRPNVSFTLPREWATTRLIAFLLAALLPAGACTGGAGPKPTPTDVARAFLRIAQSAEFSARYVISGTGKIGAQPVTWSGQGALKGPDSQDTITVRIRAEELVIQSVTSDGTDYSKQGDGPWLRSPNSHLDEILGRLSKLQDAGVVTKSGQSLHHLRPPVGFVLKPSDLGLQNESISGLDGTVDFYARNDGTPTLLVIDANWEQTEQGETQHVETKVSYALSAIGAPVTVAAPKEVWTEFTSDKRGYSIAYPPEWEAREDQVTGELPGDGFLGPSGQFVFVASQRLPAGTTLNEATGQEIRGELRDFGKRPEANEATQLGGERARLLTYHVVQNSSPLYILVVVSVHGTRGYYVVWYNSPGSEAADKARLGEFIASFSFTE